MFPTIEHMTVQRMDHVGIVVDRTRNRDRLCYVRGPEGIIELAERIG